MLLAALVPALGIGSLDALAGGLYLAAAAVGLAFAVGVGGIPSLAQGGFVGVGAVVAALLRADAAWPLVPAALAGGAAAGALGVASGLLVARLRPALAAVATLLVTWLVVTALDAFPSTFGGASGLVVPPSLSARAHYELALGLLALSALAFAALSRSAPGLRLAALREHAAAAVAAGVPAVRLRAAAFAVSAVFAGVAGGFAVDLAGVADASSYGPELSFALLVAVLVGGAASALGGPAGVAVLGIVALAARNVAGVAGDLAARFETMAGALLVLLILAGELEGIVPELVRRLPGTGRGRVGVAFESRPPVPLRARGLEKAYGSVRALDVVDLDVEPGTIHALVGPNGSGKTTALRVLAGATEVDGGVVELGASDVSHDAADRRVARGVARTLQPTAVFGGLTALENVLVGVAVRRRFGGLGRALVSTPRFRGEAAAARATALEALALCGLRDRAGLRADALTTTEQRLLMLAVAVGTGAGALLLDEPSAGIGEAELPRLEALLRALRDRGHALLLVEHNLRLVRALADRVTVLDGGRAIASGPPDSVWSDEAVQSVFLGRRA